MRNINITGVQTPPPPENRTLLYLEITGFEVDGSSITLKWLSYYPLDTELDYQEYVNSIEQDIYTDIENKIQIWNDLDPKYEIIENDFGGEPFQRDFVYTEFVKPTIPDNYAIRRDKYPDVTEQLDAIWKGDTSTDYFYMRDKILDVKNSYEDSEDKIKQQLVMAINAHRDYRVQQGFEFNGVLFDSRPEDQKRIAGANIMAMTTIMTGGGMPGDYYWHGGEEPFSWITFDNSIVQMDAPTVIEFGKTASEWESKHVFAARLLKNMNPIPNNFKDNIYWP